MGSIWADVERLSQVRLGPSDLKEIAGLSYRQLNEWDKRAAFTSERKQPRGWRTVDAWQAMALAIAADLRRQFGIPLAKQGILNRWLLGRTHTGKQVVDVFRAEGALFDFAGRERQEFEGWIREILSAAGELAREQASGLADCSESDPEPEGEPPWGDTPDSAVASVLPRLLRRGWSEEAAGRFGSVFFALSRGRRSCDQAIRDYVDLVALAEAANDDAAYRAIISLLMALVPIFDAFLATRSGHRVFLLTDLEHIDILADVSLLEIVNRDLFPVRRIVLKLNSHINAVQQSVLGCTTPDRPWKEIAPSADEREVLGLVRRRDFSRMIVEPRGDGFAVQVERRVAATDAPALLDRLGEHDFQTITLKQHRGKVVDALQKVQLRTGSPDSGKTPTRKPTGK